MSTFFFAILAGVVWMGLTSETSWGSFAVGVTLSLTIARIEGARARRPFGLVRALHLSWLGTYLVVVFLWEMVVANVIQLRIVLAPRIDVRPGWVQFASNLETPAMRALLGALIALIPGSFTYEESATHDGRWIISLHVLDLRDEVAIVEHIRARFERTLCVMERL